ncbi:hypothetical protein AAFF_G00238030 [Aldrovandia affinis]|uniref:Uncharacterized protein n=1 Tax=Aldrovandia affinis TaxID=143900 RepID=A0AAD7W3Y2_9TELE|nr:hypothetical protein AAFF_G00238030 [Aldrovandia affinis]
MKESPSESSVATASWEVRDSQQHSFIPYRHSSRGAPQEGEDSTGGSSKRLRAPKRRVTLSASEGREEVSCQHRCAWACFSQSRAEVGWKQGPGDRHTDVGWMDERMEREDKDETQLSPGCKQQAPSHNPLLLPLRRRAHASLSNYRVTPD